MGKIINEFDEFKEGNRLDENWIDDISSAASSFANWVSDKSSSIYLSLTGDESSTSSSAKTTPSPPADTPAEQDKQTVTQKIFGILASRGTLPKEMQAFYYREAEKQKRSGIGWADTGIGLKNTELDKSLEKLSPEEISAGSKAAALVAGASKVLAPDYSKMGSFDYSMSGSFRSYSYEDYVSLAEKEGYKIDPEKWTLLGLRNKLSVRKKHINGFVDALIMLSPKGVGKAHEYQATTFPGMVFRVRPYRAYFIQRGISWLGIPPSNRGVSILQPGSYKYRVGKYKGKDSLLQEGDVVVERYSLVDSPNEATKISSYSPGKRQKGNFGILVHRAGANTTKIDNHSAGCQIPKRSSDMDEIIKLTSGPENKGRIDYILIEL